MKTSSATDHSSLGTVACFFLRPLRRSLEARGVAAHSFLPTSSDESLRLSHRAAREIWAQAMRADDALVGLRAANALMPGDYGPLEYAIRSSANLRAAFQRIDRYHGLLNERAHVSLHEHDQAAQAQYQANAVDTPPAYIDFVLASWLHMVRQLTSPSFVPSRALLPFAAPADTSMHRAVFGEHVQFDAAEASLFLPRALLDAPLTHADHALVNALDRHIEQSLSTLAPARPWSQRVRQEVARQLPDGLPTLEKVGAALAISTRALRRRLLEEETSYVRVVDALRRELALEMTQNPALSLPEVAFALGFSEPSAFHRAFRRWTGRTPRGH